MESLCCSIPDLVTRHPHVIIDRGAERRKTSASHRGSLRTSLGSQNTTHNAASGNTICEIVFSTVLSVEKYD